MNTNEARRSRQRAAEAFKKARRSGSDEPLRMIELMWLDGNVPDRTYIEALAMKDHIQGRIRRKHRE